MKQLPVPALGDTLSRFLAAVEPLLDAQGLAATERAAAEFATGVGPQCQAELERFAAAGQVEGESWLSRAWLDGYLDVRAPLALASNVAFRIAWPTDSTDSTESTGLGRAAEVAHAFATVHLAYLRGETEPEVTPRGDPVDGAQWVVAAGGLRHPRADRDESRIGPLDPADREIGVLWRGHYFAVPISDAGGLPLPASALEAALASVVELDQAAEDFAAPSSLGSDRLARYLDALLADAHNRATYDRLAKALFVIRLGDENGDEAEQLRRCVFEPGQAWVYKPVTYQVQLSGDYVGVHLEHSLTDGATLKGLIQTAQSVMASSEAKPVAPAVAPTELTWTVDPNTRASLDRELAELREEVSEHRVRIERVPNPVPERAGVSLDAVQQWLMLFAQLTTYGRVRSTYEAVDMREYAAGRTECLRPNTLEAVALVRALQNGAAGPEQVRAAADAHRGWVKAAKSGQGIDRHLLGLRLAADRLGLRSPLHEDPGYRRLTTDFLSTTSLGDRATILRCGFAPTSQGGVGFYYVPDGTVLEFTVCYRQDEADRIEELIGNLHRGALALAAPLRELAREAS